MTLSRRSFFNIACAPVLGSALSGCASGSFFAGKPVGPEPLFGRPSASPIIIAHRGASGYLPEHTLPAYELAAALGADYIEPDLVFTKDGRLIARHDNYLSSTTDIADRAEFADRKTEKPGRDQPDWFTEDFTLAEIKTLRARQALPFRSKAADGRFTIPTFDEVISVAQKQGKKYSRAIGVYPETKRPGYFKNLGYDFPKAVLSALARAGWSHKDAPVFIQSFETPVLKEMRGQTELPLIYLAESATGLDFHDVARFAHGIGPFKELLADRAGQSTGFIEAAHAAGLKVHPWTFRADQLPDAFQTAHAEFEFYFKLGVDGVFTDFPNTAYAARLAREVVNS